MPDLTLEFFSGILPGIDIRSLPDGIAQSAVNANTLSSKLNPYRKPLEIATPSKSNPISIFRIDNGGADFWLNWTRDVDVVRGPIAGDTQQWLYYTGDGEPRVTNFALATSSPPYPTAAYVLGVPQPTAAPTGGFTGGSGTAETRSYVYTLVNPKGEEGSPSAPVTITGFVNSTSWNLTDLQTTPNSAGTVTAVSSSAGVTTYTMPANDTRFLRVGEEITFAGIEATVNGTWTLTEVTATTVKATTGSSYTNATVSGTWSRVASWMAGTWKQRIYRTDTQAQYRFVAEQTAATSYNDTIANSALSLTTLSDVLYTMPVPTLRGMVILPNGSLAAFDGYDVYLSVPFKPWAWPQAYRQTVPFKIVGLGVFGSTLVIVTEGLPYMLMGAHPETMLLDRAADTPHPCTAKRSIASTQVGVMWETPYGLALSGPGGTVLATASAFRRPEEWTQYRPIFAAHYKGWYFGFNTTGGFMYTRDATGDVFMPLSPIPVEAWEDYKTGKLYLVLTNKIQEWDAHPTFYLEYDWRSKRYVLPAPLNLGAARVYADFTALADASAAAAQQILDDANNAAILAGAELGLGYETKTGGAVNDSMVNEYMVGGSALVEGDSGYGTRYATLRFYAEGVLVHTKTITSRMAFRLPAGFKSTDWDVRASGNMAIYKIEMATTMHALREA